MTEDFFMTRAEVSKLVSERLRVAESTVRKHWTNQPDFPKPFQMGGVIRWKRSDIESWLGGEKCNA